MPELPLSPPTDNLYKFLAIGGLLLTAFSIIYPFLLVDRERERLITLDHEDALMTIAQNRWKEDDKIEAQNLKFDNEYIKVEGTNLPKQVGLDIIRLEENNDAVMRAETAKVDEIVANDRYTGNLEKHHAFKGMAISVICICTAALGMWLTIYGFAMWYFRVQQYQDFLLKSEAERKGYIPLDETTDIRIVVPRWIPRWMIRLIGRPVP